MSDYPQLSVNQATLREQCSLAEIVPLLARHGIHGVAVWRDTLHECGVKRGAQLLRDHNMTVTGYCVGGLLSDPDPAVFEQSLDDNRRIIEEAAEINAQCVVFLAGGLAVGVKNIDAARDRALEGLSLLIPEARAAGVVLGLEPLHPMVCASRSVLSTMKAANDWRDQLEAPDVVGIVVDTYNVWWDPDLSQEIVRAGQAICAFHVADWLIDTGDLRLDRGMPGDGVIDIPGIRALVENTGYTGRREVEIFSQGNWWRRDPDEVLEIIKARYEHFI